MAALLSTLQQFLKGGGGKLHHSLNHTTYSIDNPTTPGCFLDNFNYNAVEDHFFGIEPPGLQKGTKNFRFDGAAPGWLIAALILNAQRNY
jgi:hypothetical protein